MDRVRNEITEQRTRDQTQESMKTQLRETEIIYVEHSGYLFLCEIDANSDRVLDVPEGWKTTDKQFYIWEYQPVFPDSGKAVCQVGRTVPCSHAVAGFYISLPDELSGDEKSVMLSEHPFPQDQNGTMKEVSLYVKGRQNQILDPVSAVLRVNGREKGRYRIPVKILGSQEYEDTFEKMYHGK